jgi:hypothetical protein
VNEKGWRSPDIPPRRLRRGGPVFGNHRERHSDHGYHLLQMTRSWRNKRIGCPCDPVRRLSSVCRLSLRERFPCNEYNLSRSERRLRYVCRRSTQVSMSATAIHPTVTPSITSGTSEPGAYSARSPYPSGTGLDFTDPFVFLDAQAVKRLRGVDQVGYRRRRR